MEYKVIYFERHSEEEAIKALNKQINELLSNGWKTQGGVCVVQDSREFYHVYQTVVNNHPRVEPVDFHIGL